MPRTPFALLIDDDEILMQTIKRRLGWPALTATTLAAGLELARAYQPDVVVLDDFIGDERGFDHIEAFRAAAPRAALMMMSGLLDDAEGMDALRRGAVACWPKSELGTLRDVVASMLSVRGAGGV